MPAALPVTLPVTIFFDLSNQMAICRIISNEKGDY
jgi:hypothetical protein